MHKDQYLRYSHFLSARGFPEADSEGKSALFVKYNNDVFTVISWSYFNIMYSHIPE